MTSEAVKRPRCSDNESGSPISNCKVIFTPIRIGAVENAEEIDKKILLVQNRKLTERQRAWKKLEFRLRQKISRLEHQKSLDDARLSTIDVYWEQLDRTVRITLERLISPGSTDASQQCNGNARPMVSLLSNAACESVDETLKQKTESTVDAIERLCSAFKSLTSLDNLKNGTEINKASGLVCQRCETLSMEQEELENKLRALENKCELQRQHLESQRSRIEDLEFESEKWLIKEARLHSALLDEHNANSAQKQRSNTSAADKRTSSSEGEIQRLSALAESRLNELNEMADKCEKLSKEVCELRMKLRTVPVDAIRDSTEYKILEAERSKAVEEREKMYKTVNEVKSILHYQKQAYDSQLASIERDEIAKQRSLKNELTALQSKLSIVESERDQAKVECEKIKARSSDYPDSIVDDVEVMQKTLDNYVKRLKNERTQYRKELLNQRQENENLRKALGAFKENGLTVETAVRKKIQALEDILKSVRSELKGSKEQEATLVNELEATGSAFEEMHEKNRKLLSLLAERESVNFRLITEGVRRSKCIELLTEAKDLIEKELQQAIRTELDLSTQLNNEQARRIAGMERAQAELEAKLHLSVEAAERSQIKLAELERAEGDLKRRNEEQRAELDKLRKLVSQHSADLERANYLLRRAQEENKLLGDKSNKGSAGESEDLQILQLEIQELRDSMKCTSCHSRSLDTVIAKCFHVFCRECLRARLESRQRKCPRCNTAFGANDVHKIYLYSS